MLAEIVTIGDELLIGQIQDTNSTFLAQGLTNLGFQIVRKTSISDNRNAIRQILDECIHRSNLIIFTGGLGPTNDDITKKAFAEYFQSKFILNEDVLKNIYEFFQSRNLPLSKVNKEQAEVPDNCEVLFNYNGTAPGMLFRFDGSYIVSLPGVPFEMKPLFENELVPVLKDEFELPQRMYRTYHLAGVPESLMAEKLVDFENKLPENASLAYLPSPGILKLRLGVFSSESVMAEEQFSKLENALKKHIAPYFFGVNGVQLQEVVGNLLKSNNVTVSTAESCTGGNIAYLITSISGSSEYFLGSVVAYSNKIKTSILGVNEELLIENGAVSKEVVEAMADNVRKVFNSNYGIATSGIAGPTGGSEQKPVGTIWIAVSGPKGIVSKRYQFGEHRGRNIERSSIAALDLLRKTILEKNTQTK